MKRLVVPTLATAALLSLSACKGGASADAASLIPDGAEMIGGVNIKALTRSSLYKDNEDTLEDNAEAKKALEALEKCDVDPLKLDALVFGASTKDDGFALVIVGKGVGVEDNIKCVAEAEGESVEFEDKNGHRAFKLDGGEDGWGYIVDKKTVALASESWADDVEELIDGKGDAAIKGSLKDIYKNTDHKKHIWFGGHVPENAGSRLGIDADAKDIAGWVDFSGGLALEVTASFDSKDDAKKMAEETQSKFDEVKGMAGIVGVPQSVVESVKIKAKGDEMVVKAKASKKELEEISNHLETLGKQFGG